MQEALGLAQQAEQIGATAATRMFIAQVNAALGHHAAAYEGAERCLREVDADRQTTAANRQAIRTACESARDEASRRVGRLVLRAPPEAPAELVVRLDGLVLDRALLGAERVVDAGEVSITATVPGAPSWERRETVRAGATTTVMIVVPSPSVDASDGRTATARGEVAAVRVNVAREGVSRGATQRTLGWAGGATGLALVAGAAVAGAVFQSTASDYDAQQCETSVPTDACSAMFSRLETLNTLQWVGYIGGGLLTATGAILILTAPRGESHREAVLCGPGPGDVGVACATRF